MFKEVYNKELFIETITSLRDQYDYDVKKADQLGKVFDVEFNPYNNSNLSNAIFSALSIQFDVETIKSFCYELDFGRRADMTIEDLWGICKILKK